MSIRSQIHISLVLGFFCHLRIFIHHSALYLDLTVLWQSEIFLGNQQTILFLQYTLSVYTLMREQKESQSVGMDWKSFQLKHFDALTLQYIVILN